MHYIPENDMAFDPAGLGFPSIGSCQAVCVHTTRGLYGFHDLKSAPRGNMDALGVSNAKLGVFANWVTGEMQNGETITAIYGVINRDKQYSPDQQGNADWQNVLLGVAGALGFNGPVYGHRLNSNRHLPADESAYVKVTLNAGNISIGYKRWSKMESDQQNKVAPVSQRRVVWRNNLDAYNEEALFGAGTVAPVVRINQNKGENLNVVANGSMIQFQ